VDSFAYNEKRKRHL